MAAKQTPFRLAPDIRERLVREARRLGLSLNGALNVTLDRCLPPLDRPATPANQDHPKAAAPDLSDDDDDDQPLIWPSRG